MTTGHSVEAQEFLTEGAYALSSYALTYVALILSLVSQAQLLLSSLLLLSSCILLLLLCAVRLGIVSAPSVADDRQAVVLRLGRGYIYIYIYIYYVYMICRMYTQIDVYVVLRLGHGRLAKTVYAQSPD